MVQVIKQKFEIGWCSSCKKMVRFVTHANYKKPRWVCTSNGCFNWEHELKGKPPEKSWGSVYPLMKRSYDNVGMRLK